MAKKVLPDAMKRRHLLERELPREEALRVAEAYLAEERDVEALAFLAKGEAWDKLESLRDQAVAAGDAFLLREASAALGEEPGAARWKALAEAARAAGMDAYAADAERQATRGDE